MTIKVWVALAATVVALIAAYAVAIKADADWSRQCEKAGGISVKAPGFKLKCIKNGREIM